MSPSVRLSVSYLSSVKKDRNKLGEFRVTHQVPFNVVACLVFALYDVCDGRTDRWTDVQKYV